MPIERAAQYLNVAFAVILVLRLLALRLIGQYKILAAFLFYDLAISVATFAIPWRKIQFDYRIGWLLERPLAWLLYVWVVYSMLQRVMNDHRGVLSLSKKVLACCFFLALLVSFISARAEFSLAVPYSTDRIFALVQAGLVAERAFCTASLILLGFTLVFLLWFPVDVSRNVAILCAGLLIFFAAKTALLLISNIWAPRFLRMVSTGLILIFTSCLAVWLLFLNRTGELRRVRPGHSWKPEEQKRLIGRLEALNEAMIRAGSTRPRSVRPEL
jgi:hypothetical protein